MGRPMEKPPSTWGWQPRKPICGARGESLNKSPPLIPPFGRNFFCMRVKFVPFSPTRFVPESPDFWLFPSERASSASPFGAHIVAGLV